MERHPVPELPSLEPGMTLLDSDDRGALHSLVADHAMRSRGDVHWVDVGGHATTRPMARMAGRRLLKRVQVARAFTAFQHHSIVESLAERAREGVLDTTLIVAPAVDAAYLDDDLREREAEAMALGSLARLYGVARSTGCPLLVTHEDGFEGHVEQAADRVLECRSTPLGPRFTGDGFETLVYPSAAGMQTTLAFWRRVIQARRRRTTETPKSPEVAVGTH